MRPDQRAMSLWLDEQIELRLLLDEVRQRRRRAIRQHFALTGKQPPPWRPSRIGF